ncbi:MAG TPA: hypothetical protein VN026_10275 [Bacteroidia bacterium]|jgi:hypothetical protein|nr:hypothetical protein [Bacteroidia bacterium]
MDALNQKKEEIKKIIPTLKIELPATEINSKALQILVLLKDMNALEPKKYDFPISNLSLTINKEVNLISFYENPAYKSNAPKKSMDRYLESKDKAIKQIKVDVTSSIA